MVMAGQFLERPTLVPVGKLVLEALSHRGDRRPPLLVLPPRPEEGGSMDHVVAAELVWAAAQAGHPTLRFNFQGVGASQGTRGTGEALVGDAESAMRLLQENTGATGIAVLTLGGAAGVGLALRRRHPAILGLCCVSPVALRAEDLLRARVAPLVICGELDHRLPRAALASAASEMGGTLEVVPGADPIFTSNLAQLGKLVVPWLERLGGEEV